MVSDFKLMELQAEVLFGSDHLGRITKTNGPGGKSSPLLFLGRTEQGDVVRFPTKLPEPYEKELTAIINQQPADFNPLHFVKVLNNWKSPCRFWLGPTYAFPEEFVMSSSAIALTEENKDMLQPGFPDLLEQWKWRTPFFVVIEDGKAVSVCCSARKSEKAAEAGLKTLNAYQGKGFGTEAVIAWAQEIRREELIPLYSTTWNNASSQAIARKLDLYKYGVNVYIE